MAVSEIGLLNDLVAILQKTINNNVLLGFAVIIAVSVVTSGFVDNRVVPHIIAMLPVTATPAEAPGLKVGAPFTLVTTACAALFVWR